VVVGGAAVAMAVMAAAAVVAVAVKQLPTLMHMHA
jgi:hypothetical protein